MQAKNRLTFGIFFTAQLPPMTFDELLNLIETQLLGKRLSPISLQSKAIILIRVETDQGRYFISEEDDHQKQPKTRSISELKIIWNMLKKDRFCSVVQALYGSSSSRSHPETIFANLPFIQHFKYKNKQHLLLRQNNSREAGTIAAVKEPELSEIKARIDNFLSLSVSEIHADVVLLLKDANKQLNGHNSQHSTNIKPLYRKLELLEKKLAATQIVNDLDLPNAVMGANTTRPLPSTESFPDSEEFTGRDDNPIERKLNKDIVAQVRNTKMYPLTLVLTLIFDRVEHAEIELQPDFQRKDRIWSQEKKSKLIESILMGLPLPLFYFGVDPLDNPWIVVDGRQRITTIYDFMKGRIVLKGLEVLHELNGCNFEQLSKIQIRRIKEYQITAYMIEHNTSENNTPDVLIELFQRVNTYGTKLSSQEIRSALNQGSSVSFLRYLASSEAFLRSTQSRVNPARQGDMELCLNALAFMLLGYQHFTNQSWDGFLTEAMRVMNNWNSVIDKLDSEYLDKGKAQITSTDSHYYTLSKQFEQGAQLAAEVFEDNAFRKDISGNKKAISSTLFQIIISYFSQLTSSQVKILRNNKDALVETLYGAIEDDTQSHAEWLSETYKMENRGFYYALSTSTGKKVTVHYRFEAFANILSKSTGIDIQQTSFLSREDSNDNLND